MRLTARNLSERTLKMKRFLLFPALMLAVSSMAFGQVSAPNAKITPNAIAGTWRADLARSQRAPNHQFQSLTLRFEFADGDVLLSYSGVNMSGKEESGTRKMHPDGKEYPVAGAPGVIEITRWAGSHILESIARKDEKVVGQSTYEVSSDGKTLTARIKGVDASGASFEQMIVLDRQ
jgi:hypothetical protein